MNKLFDMSASIRAIRFFVGLRMFANFFSSAVFVLWESWFHYGDPLIVCSLLFRPSSTPLPHYICRTAHIFVLEGTESPFAYYHSSP